MTNPTDMGDDPVIASLINNTVEASKMLVGAALQCLPDKHQGPGPHAVVMTLASMGGPFGGLIAICMRDGLRATDDHVLFAALLTAGSYAVCGGEHAYLEFGPESILDAMQSFERMTGRKPDAILNEPMAMAAREVEREGAGALDAFMAGLQNPPSNVKH